MVICKPGSVTPHTKFEVEVYILKKKKEVDIHHSTINIDRSFILEQLMLQVKLFYLQELKW